MESNDAAVAELVQLVRQHPVVTLLYGARDEEHNQAVVLRECLLQRLREPESGRGG